MAKEIRIVLVEPLYQINLGYIARVMGNFGLDKLYLVNPRCDYRGAEALKYSKHASSILKGAKVSDSIEEAVKGSSIVVGTTGLWRKSNAAFFNVYALQEAHRFVKNNSIALLIGRDDTGLTKEELRKCDLTIFIPTDKSYPVLNISHALAIILYELRKEHSGETTAMSRAYADSRSINGMKALLWKSIKGRRDIRDKKAVMFAFEHVINRSSATKKELNAIAIALSNGIKTKEKGKRERK